MGFAIFLRFHHFGAGGGRRIFFWRSNRRYWCLSEVKEAVFRSLSRFFCRCCCCCFLKDEIAEMSGRERDRKTGAVAGFKQDVVSGRFFIQERSGRGFKDTHCLVMHCWTVFTWATYLAIAISTGYFKQVFVARPEGFQSKPC